MEELEMQAVIEGLLYVCGDEGLKLEEAARTLGVSEQEAEKQLSVCKDRIQNNLLGLEVKINGNKYQLVTNEKTAPFIEALASVPERGKLSQASLETLAIIAYNQPITRTEIDDIRGVKSEKAIQTLINKVLITDSGRAQSIGRPKLYNTTDRFLEYFDLSSLDELPTLDDVEEHDVTEEADLFFDALK
ncbi:SMC-Scp complex subunit ScpB [Alteribacillus sp. YIM 98480]|uniref:SMC-Scp complex subunit ScpB n=1 Tax=Alteribacillus sp. YIM 98480 TaxID=2606599 RepID=UPI00131B2E3E|nr:SMC-Scp complex subunit ScpB [Alteribacillus sp. YIM 98480]